MARRTGRSYDSNGFVFTGDRGPISRFPLLFELPPLALLKRSTSFRDVFDGPAVGVAGAFEVVTAFEGAAAFSVGGDETT